MYQFGCVALLNTGSRLKHSSRKTLGSRLSLPAPALRSANRIPRGYIWAILYHAASACHERTRPSHRSIIARRQTHGLPCHFRPAWVPSRPAWAPSQAIGHAVLLGRDSWMRFTSGTYHTPPSGPSDARVVGELALSHHSSRGASTFARDSDAKGELFRLCNVESGGLSLGCKPQLVEVDLVRRAGAGALAGNHMVVMLPPKDMCSVPE